MGEGDRQKGERAIRGRCLRGGTGGRRGGDIQEEARRRRKTRAVVRK